MESVLIIEDLLYCEDSQSFYLNIDHKTNGYYSVEIRLSEFYHYFMNSGVYDFFEEKAKKNRDSAFIYGLIYGVDKVFDKFSEYEKAESVILFIREVHFNRNELHFSDEMRPILKEYLETTGDRKAA